MEQVSPSDRITVRPDAPVKPTAIDLFAGAGGSTEGLRLANFNVLAAVENDPDAADSYAANHPYTQLYDLDISDVKPERVMADVDLKPGELTLLLACPPCQGWSTLGSGDSDDPRNELVDIIVPWLTTLRPQAFIVENVPGLKNDPRLKSLRRNAEAAPLGYTVSVVETDAAKFGVPQRRRRLIMIGVKGRAARNMPRALPGTWIPRPTPKSARSVFVGDKSDALDTDDPISVGRTLRPRTVRRIEAIPPGGSRFDLPPDLQLDCHRELGRQASGPYGRIRFDEPAPTMTTRCTTPSCGRFVHPTENRGITLREAAAIQSFPDDYQFYGSYGAIEAQIGNAVPVAMAEGLAKIALALLANDQSSTDRADGVSTDGLNAR